MIAAARTAGRRARSCRSGLQTLLGEGGGPLSGGEGQRVRLGRALSRPERASALLDEPFRGLDRDQRRALLAEARTWWKDITLLCVTHDVGETRDFARVLVIEDGRSWKTGAPRALAAGPRAIASCSRREAREEDPWNGAHWRRLSLADGQLQSTRAGP